MPTFNQSPNFMKPTRKVSIRFVSTYAGFVGESTLLEEIYSQVFTETGEVKEGVSRPLGEDFTSIAES